MANIQRKIYNQFVSMTNYFMGLELIQNLNFVAALIDWEVQNNERRPIIIDFDLDF